MTISCLNNDTMKTFIPKYKNETSAKQSILEYHAMPIYESIPGLKLSNGLTNTLAIEKANNFNFNVQNNGTNITTITKIVTTKVNTMGNEPPLAIYELNKVLMPKELFKRTLPPTLALALDPAVDAEPPKLSKSKPKVKHKVA